MERRVDISDDGLVLMVDGGVSVAMSTLVCAVVDRRVDDLRGSVSLGDVDRRHWKERSLSCQISPEDEV